MCDMNMKNDHAWTAGSKLLSSGERSHNKKCSSNSSLFMRWSNSVSKKTMRSTVESESYWAEEGFFCTHISSYFFFSAILVRIASQLDSRAAAGVCVTLLLRADKVSSHCWRGAGWYKILIGTKTNWCDGPPTWLLHTWDYFSDTGLVLDRTFVRSPSNLVGCCQRSATCSVSLFMLFQSVQRCQLSSAVKFVPRNSWKARRLG